MVRMSARLAAKRAAELHGPDRLSALPQELFLRICDYLVNDENEYLVKFGLTLLFGHIRPASLTKGLRALHCASKLLRDKTSASICKLGFVMTVPGLKALLHMADEPQIAPHIAHVRLLVPAEMWRNHKGTRASYTQVADMLTGCFIRLINLRKVELSGIKSQVRETYMADLADQYSWTLGLLLCALHVSKARVTELIYDEGAEEMRPCLWPYPILEPRPISPVPPAWLSGLENIERFRAVEHDPLRGRHIAYTEQILHAMPKLKELTVTPTIPAALSFLHLERGWGHYNHSTTWMEGVLQCNYDWRLTTFHASDFHVEKANSLKRFLRANSPTLRDLTISDVIVSDSDHQTAKSFWTEIFQIILDDMNLRKGKFHDLLSWIRSGWGYHMSVAMHWDPTNSLELDKYGRKFEEVAKVKGVTGALADWKDGMVMVKVRD